MRVGYHWQALLGLDHPDYEIGNETGVRLRRNPDRVRAPDAYLIMRNRLPRGRSITGYLEVVPDWIVEVVSPNDRASEVQDKVQEWLHAGARLVWVLYPKTRTLLAHRGRRDVVVFESHEEADGAPVLPDFRCRVDALFPPKG